MDKMIKLYLEVSRNRKGEGCEYFFPNHQLASDQHLGLGLRHCPAEVVSPQPRLQAALVQCVSSVPFTSSTGMAGVCASGSFQLTPPPTVRHHLPTNLVTKKVIFT